MIRITPKVKIRIWDKVLGAVYIDGKQIPVFKIEISPINGKDLVTATITMAVDEIEADDVLLKIKEQGEVI